MSYKQISLAFDSTLALNSSGQLTVASPIAGAPAALSAETARAEAAEAVLSTSISVETMRAETAEATITSSLAAKATTTQLTDAINNLDISQYALSAALGNYVPYTERGIANGVASLDQSGKVPVVQLPSSIMQYLGTWNAATNTPALANGTGSAGDCYIVSIAGSRDFGAGTITFQAGEFCICNGTVWQATPSGNTVASVNGYTGAVELAATDVNALSLDQTTPQAVQNGAPDFQGGIETSAITDDGEGIQITSNNGTGQQGIAITSNSGNITINLNSGDEGNGALRINVQATEALQVDNAGVVHMNQIADDGQTLTITGNNSNENEEGILITNNAGKITVNLNGSDEGGGALRINYFNQTQGNFEQSLEVDDYGNVTIGSSNGETLRLAAQPAPSNVTDGAIYYDSTTFTPYYANANSVRVPLAPTNTWIFEKDNQPPNTSGWLINSGYMIVQQFQYSIKVIISANVFCGGTFSCTIVPLAGMFSSELGDGSILIGGVMCDKNGTINITGLNEGNTDLYGIYELPFSAVAF